MARKRANHEGTVYKLPSGHWCAQITLTGQRLSKVFGTQKEGLDWIRKTRGQIDDGMTYTSTKVTLGEYMDSWLCSTRSSRRPSTSKQYEQLTRSYILPNIGQIKIIDLRPEHIERFYT